MSMYGTYKIYKDGELVAEQKNKLTVLGRANALKSMLGQNQYFANSFGIGIASTPNESETFLTRTDLEFPVGKYPIAMGTLGRNDTDTLDGLVYVARITDTSRYNINEVGLFSNVVTDAVMVDDLTLFNFESGDPLKETVSSVNYYLGETYAGRSTTILDNESVEFSQYRIGTNAVKITGSTKTIFFDDLVSDFSDIESSDSFVLAAYCSAGTKTLSVKFTANATTTYPATSATYTFALATGYNIISSQRLNNTVNWSEISKIEITTPSNLDADYIILDGLRVKKNKPVDAVDGLVSRAVLSTPIEKDSGSIIDIQYILSMGLTTT